MAGKTAIVLGIGPGLGAAVARRFAREGYALGLLARGMEKLEPVKKEIEALGGRAAAVNCDATSAASVAGAFATVKQELGPASVLVYNAGAFKMGGALEISAEEFEACWRANCAGAFHAAQQVLPDMLAANAGTILFTGATASLRGSARFSCLAVGKFGLRALSQSLAREFGARGIHVAHVVIDGQIDTPQFRRMMPGRETNTLLSPDAIADVYFQLHTQDSTTWTLELDLRPALEKF